MSPNSMLCVAVRWLTRADMVKALAADGTGLMLVGDTIFDPMNSRRFDVEITEHDPAVVQAFKVSGKGKLAQETLDEIEHHTFVLYISAPGGSLEAARKLMGIGSRVGDAGGLAVKVESSGAVHSMQAWLDLSKDSSPAALYRAYVVLVRGEPGLYSCGMHNLGERDTVLAPPPGAPHAETLADLQAFLGYLLLEHPELHDGETFSHAPDTTRYPLRSGSCTLYPEDWLFFNPYGMWYPTTA